MFSFAFLSCFLAAKHPGKWQRTVSFFFPSSLLWVGGHAYPWTRALCVSQRLSILGTFKRATLRFGGSDLCCDGSKQGCTLRNKLDWQTVGWVIERSAEGLRGQSFYSKAIWHQRKLWLYQQLFLQSQTASFNRATVSDTTTYLFNFFFHELERF